MNSKQLAHVLSTSVEFRRLALRTQCFNDATGPISTPISHSVEAAHWAGWTASRLGLDSDFTYLITLAHDLGKPPQGQVAEQVLNEWSPEGFTHAENGVRVLRDIEIDSRVDFGDEVKTAVSMHSTRLNSPAFQDLPAKTAVMVVADKVSHISSDASDAMAAGIIGSNLFPSEAVDSLGSDPTNWPVLVSDDMAAQYVDCRQPLRLSANVLQALVQIKEFLVDNVYAPCGAGHLSASDFRAVLDYLTRKYGRIDDPESRLQAVTEFAGMVDDEVLSIVEHLAPDWVEVAGGSPVHLGDSHV